MRNVITLAYAFLRDDRGEDLTEYGLLATLIAIMSMVAIGDFGFQLNEFWTEIVVQISEKL